MNRILPKKLEQRILNKNKMKRLITIICLLVSIFSLQAQNTNVRAQGNYYSAKKNFQSKNYEEAINYVNKSKIALNGTNRELQFLHILAAYNLFKYEEAAKELQTYFDMEEKKIKIVYFDKSVDRLTDDETKELSMLIDPILESADNKKNNPCSRCSGTGEMNKSYSCDDCNGDGFLKKTCEKCHGKGLVKCTAKIQGEYCDNGYGSYYNLYENRYIKIRCQYCNRGKRQCYYCNTVGYSKIDCHKCDNSGVVESTTEKVTCSKCNGKGF